MSVSISGTNDDKYLVDVVYNMHTCIPVDNAIFPIDTIHHPLLIHSEEVLEPRVVAFLATIAVAAARIK